MKTLVLSMISIAATIAAMTACTSESDPINDITNPKDAKVEIKFGSAISGVETKAAITTDKFEENLNVGIFAVQYQQGGNETWSESDNFMHNVKGTTAPNNAITLEAGKSFYYPTDDLVSFYAYYPHTSSVTCTASAAPSVNVTINAKETEQIDYMWATPLKGKNRDSGKQTLTFNHALSLLEIQVVKASDVVETNLVVNKISFNANKSTATMNIETGVITDNASDAAITCTTETALNKTVGTTGSTMASFVLLPSSTITNLTVTIGTKDYIIDTPSMTLNAQERTTFTVTLSSKGISFDTNINQWTGNNTGEGNI